MSERRKSGIVEAVGFAPKGSRGDTARDLHRSVEQEARAMVREGVALDSEEAVARIRAARAKGLRAADERRRAGRVKANESKRTEAVARHGEWQTLVDAMRQKHPTWKHWRIARDLAPRCGVTARHLYKHTK